MAASKRRRERRAYVRELQKSKDKGKTKNSKWQMVYGMVATKLIRSGEFRDMANVRAVAKVLAVPVYLFSLVYDPVKTWKMKRKLAKINSKKEEE